MTLDAVTDLGTLCRNRNRIAEFDSEFDNQSLALAAPYQSCVLNFLGVVGCASRGIFVPCRLGTLNQSKNVFFTDLVSRSIESTRLRDIGSRR